CGAVRIGTRARVGCLVTRLRTIAVTVRTRARISVRHAHGAATDAAAIAEEPVIAAADFHRAGRRAAVARDDVAVVALFTRCDDAVAAAGHAAIAVTTVIVGEIAVVALFTSLDDGVSAVTLAGTA